MNILAIGAHPDDIELGAGAYLHALAKDGACVTAVVVFDGARKGSVVQRQAEQIASVRLLARNASVRFLNLPSIVPQADIVPRFYELFEECRPDLVLTHAGEDTHDDHVAVHRATLPAARRAPIVLAYETPSTAANFIPTTYYPFTSLDIKLAAVAQHESQTSKLVANISLTDWVCATAAFRGAFFRVGMAEAFVPIRQDLVRTRAIWSAQ